MSIFLLCYLIKAEILKTQLEPTRVDKSQMVPFDHKFKANVDKIRVCNAPGTNGYISSIQIFSKNQSSPEFGRNTTECKEFKFQCINKIENHGEWSWVQEPSVAYLIVNNVTVEGHGDLKNKKEFKTLDFGYKCLVGIYGFTHYEMYSVVQIGYYYSGDYTDKKVIKNNQTDSNKTVTQNQTQAAQNSTIQNSSFPILNKTQNKTGDQIQKNNQTQIKSNLTKAESGLQQPALVKLILVGIKCFVLLIFFTKGIYQYYKYYHEITCIGYLFMVQIFIIFIFLLWEVWQPYVPLLYYCLVLSINLQVITIILLHRKAKRFIPADKYQFHKNGLYICQFIFFLFFVSGFMPDTGARCGHMHQTLKGKLEGNIYPPCFAILFATYVIFAVYVQALICLDININADLTDLRYEDQIANFKKPDQDYVEKEPGCCSSIQLLSEVDIILLQLHRWRMYAFLQIFVMIAIQVFAHILTIQQREAVRSMKDPYEEVFFRCDKTSDGYKFDVNEAKGVLGTIFEMLHIACIMTMAVQCETTLLTSLEKVDFFERPFIPIKGTLEEFTQRIEAKELHFQPDMETEKAKDSLREIKDPIIPNVSFTPIELETKGVAQEEPQKKVEKVSEDKAHDNMMQFRFLRMRHKYQQNDPTLKPKDQGTADLDETIEMEALQENQKNNKQRRPSVTFKKRFFAGDHKIEEESEKPFKRRLTVNPEQQRFSTPPGEDQEKSTRRQLFNPE